MDQTKLTAHLPTVNVEITRRELPEQNAQAVTIHITATPSFDVAARWLLQASLLPVAPPFLLWANMMSAWQPWLPFNAGSTQALPEPDQQGLDGAPPALPPSSR